MLRGHLIDIVGFVENHKIVGGDELDTRATRICLETSISEIEVMIDDDELGCLSLTPHLGYPAALKVIAGASEALLPEQRLEAALDAGLVSEDDARFMRHYEREVLDMLTVDDFAFDAFASHKDKVVWHDAA